MIWATVSSQSCFRWLYRTSPYLAAKDIISLISVLTIWLCPCVESSLVLLEFLLWVFAMTRTFSWQNSISICPASFCTPRPNLPAAAAAATKSLHPCLTLWDPIDGSPPGFPVPGILQARTLEWLAISLSNAWSEKWKWSCSVMSDS